MNVATRGSQNRNSRDGRGKTTNSLELQQILQDYYFIWIDSTQKGKMLSEKIEKMPLLQTRIYERADNSDGERFEIRQHPRQSSRGVE